MRRDLVIVGHSGFAKEIEWLIQRINEKDEIYHLIGFIDKEVGGEIIGDDQWLMRYGKSLDVVIAISDARIKRRLCEIYRRNNKLSFPTVIDPCVQLGATSQYGVGNIICAGTIITIDVKIGDFNIINLDCTVGHGAVIKDYVTLNPSVNISGNATIGDGVNIGTGSQVLQGIYIGSNSVIGAGAVVTKDIPENCLAVGVPARVAKQNK